VIALSAQQSNFGINLTLVPRKPPVLNGTDGFCRKAFNPPGSSFHYSVTSIDTEGTILWDGEAHHVTGSSWMDREFGTQIFPECVQGWDWFGLRLDNGFELMITFVRFTDSEYPSTAYGTVVFPDGKTNRLTGDDFFMTASLVWTSSATGADYPMEWALNIPDHDMQLRIAPLVKNHEINSRPLWRIDYWEGPVEIVGSMGGQRVSGRGYVELTGYAQALGGKF